MKLIIVSGLSGSGKSVAMETLEDCGFYCVDNLPVYLIADFVKHALEEEKNSAYRKAAISIDSRNQTRSLTDFPNTLREIRELGVECEIIYLQADRETLLKRFSETRRKHPLSDSIHSLADAIGLEISMLDPLAHHAALTIDTSRTNVHELRELIRQRVGIKSNETLSLLFQSFGFKHGIPHDANFVFDVRCLPNPHWEPELRSKTGKDLAVADFLQKSDEVCKLRDDLIEFMENWIPCFEAENRSYLTVAIGCTGGQHRSVYLAETLARHFRPTRYNVLLHHRELS